MPSASPTTTLPAVDFDRLVEQHYGSMKRMARTFVGSDAVAEEVVQDPWLAIVAGIDRFEGRSSLQTWMFSILTNKAKTRGVRERRTTPLSCLGGGEPDEPAIDADRFQSDDDAWPGHWATRPRPGQKPERGLLSLEAPGPPQAGLGPGAA